MNDNTTSIYLTLSGDDISPRNVRMNTLFGVLRGLEGALEAMAKELGVEFDPNEAIITPGEFEESSLGIPTALNPRATDSLHYIDRAFYSDNTDVLPPVVRSELRTMQSALGERGIELELSGRGLHGVSLTKDTPPIKAPADDSLEMSSHAVVYGICMRVNRTTRDARIELHDGTGCTITALSDKQLQKLMKETGEDLDQVYRIEGKATWSMDDYRISKIDVIAIESVQRDAGELFDALRQATGETFEDVDPIDYRRVRSSRR